jgi:uncharacterized membrane protein
MTFIFKDKQMQEKAEDRDKHRRETLQLIRLERLVDVVFAIIIWRAVTFFPIPTIKEFSWEQIAPFVSANSGDFTLVLIGLLVTIIFWLQNNLLFGNLHTTDTRHTILSILQLFFLLVFVVSLRVGVELEPSSFTRAFESIAAGMVGVAASWSWSYAIKNRRHLEPKVTDAYALELRDRILAEPLTALVTLPFAFVSAVLWEISWLSYLPIAFLLRRRRRRQN